MRSGIKGFASPEEAAAAIAADTPQRKRSTYLDGLKKVLRYRDDRWFWHWDPGIFDRVEPMSSQIVWLAS